MEEKHWLEGPPRNPNTPTEQMELIVERKAVYRNSRIEHIATGEGGILIPIPSAATLQIARKWHRRPEKFVAAALRMVRQPVAVPTRDGRLYVRDKNGSLRRVRDTEQLQQFLATNPTKP